MEYSESGNYKPWDCKESELSGQNYTYYQTDGQLTDTADKVVELAKAGRLEEARDLFNTVEGIRKATTTDSIFYICSARDIITRRNHPTKEGVWDRFYGEY